MDQLETNYGADVLFLSRRDRCGSRDLGVILRSRTCKNWVEVQTEVMIDVLVVFVVGKAITLWYGKKGY